jgi:hypothetical protein
MYVISHNFENSTSSCISANVLLRTVHILLSFIEKREIRLFLFIQFIRSYFCLAEGKQESVFHTSCLSSFNRFQNWFLDLTTTKKKIIPEIVDCFYHEGVCEIRTRKYTKTILTKLNYFPLCLLSWRELSALKSDVTETWSFINTEIYYYYSVTRKNCLSAWRTTVENPMCNDTNTRI